MKKMNKLFYPTLTLFLFIGQFSNVQAFIWPFTSWYSKPSSSSNINPAPFSDLIVRPYNGEDDLTALPSNSDSTIFGELFNPPQDLGLFTENVHNQNNNNGQIVQSQTVEQFENNQQSTDPNESSIVPIRSTVGGKNQPFRFNAYHQQPSVSRHGSFYLNPENLNSKRYTYLTRIGQSAQNNPVSVQSSSTLTQYVNPGEHQYLIVQKPVGNQAQTTGSQGFLFQQQQHQQQKNQQVDQQVENNVVVQPQTTTLLDSFHQSQPQVKSPSQTQQQQIVSSFPTNNWIYLSPVNKLNSQQQPIFLETYFETNNYQPPAQYATKSGVKTKQTTGQKSVGGIKLPILSWLPSSSQMPLSHLFKAKSQHSQHQQQQQHHAQHQQSQSNQDLQKNPKQYYFYQQQPQVQTTYYVPASFSLPNSKTIYTPGYTQEITSNANNVGTTTSGGSTGNYYIQTTPFVHSNQFIKNYAQWLDRNVHQSQASVDQPRPYTTITTWSSENAANQLHFPKQTNQVSQDYKFIPSSYIETENVATSNSLPSSQSSSVSQIDSNQDLGGWESIQLPDVVNPGAATLSSSSANNAADNIEQDSQAMLTAATSPTELIINETNVQQQSSLSQQSSPGQSQSHRIVYQSMASNPVMTAVPLNSNKTVSVPSRSFTFNQQHSYSPIYQLLQSSAPFQQQSQPQTTTSSGSTGSSSNSMPQWSQQSQPQTNFTQNL